MAGRGSSTHGTWEFDPWGLSLPSGISPIPKAQGTGQVLPHNSQFSLCLGWIGKSGMMGRTKGAAAGLEFYPRTDLLEGGIKKTRILIPCYSIKTTPIPILIPILILILIPILRNSLLQVLIPEGIPPLGSSPHLWVGSGWDPPAQIPNPIPNFLSGSTWPGFKRRNSIPRKPHRGDPSRSSRIWGHSRTPGSQSRKKFGIGQEGQTPRGSLGISG